MVRKWRRAKRHPRLPVALQVPEHHAFLRRTGLECRTFAPTRREALEACEIKPAILHRRLMAALAAALNDRANLAKITDFRARLLRGQVRGTERHRQCEAERLRHPITLRGSQDTQQ